MPICSHTYSVSDPAAALAMARAAIAKQGGTLEGSSSSGTATIPTPLGAVSIAYSVGGSSVKVDVLDKPWLVSCEDVDAALTKALAYDAKPLAASVVEEADPVTRGKVIEMPVQVIEGDPGQAEPSASSSSSSSSSSKPSAVAVVAVVGLLLATVLLRGGHR